jgi:hypothetical protein
MFGSIIQLKSKLYNDEMKDKTLVFRDYPNLKIGFSTQDFQKAMPVDVESLTEIMEYASQEGYQFIMLRDDQAKLPEEDCKRLAQIATKNQIDVIYEIHKNPLDSGYNEVFERGLANTLLFPGPGIIRTLVSKSEFDADPDRKGWNRNELAQLAKLSEASASAAMAKKVSFIVENFNEAFFGDGFTYYGLVDFFANTVFTGLQFDISNPFRNTSRDKADPERVFAFLSTLGKRWVTTHLKTAVDGEMQPVLTENPISVERIVDLMVKGICLL